jgi:hypothetical protein
MKISLINVFVEDPQKAHKFNTDGSLISLAQVNRVQL